MEIWKDITGMDGLYKVSSTGKVASCDRDKHQHGSRRKGRILKTRTNIHNQVIVTTSIYGERKDHLVSRLVAQEFIRPLKKGDLVFHLDMNQENNNKDNLKIKKSMKSIMDNVNNKKCDKFENVKRENLTQSQVLNYLYYSDGELYLRKKTSLLLNIGEKAGYLQNGTWKVNLLGVKYNRNFLIYFMHTGEKPDFVLPKDGNQLNGRFENLYKASAKEHAIKHRTIDRLNAKKNHPTKEVLR